MIYQYLIRPPLVLSLYLVIKRKDCENINNDSGPDR